MQSGMLPLTATTTTPLRPTWAAASRRLPSLTFVSSNPHPPPTSHHPCPKAQVEPPSTSPVVSATSSTSPLQAWSSAQPRQATTNRLAMPSESSQGHELAPTPTTLVLPMHPPPLHLPTWSVLASGSTASSIKPHRAPRILRRPLKHELVPSPMPRHQHLPLSAPSSSLAPAKHRPLAKSTPSTQACSATTLLVGGLQASTRPISAQLLARRQICITIRSLAIVTMVLC